MIRSRAVFSVLIIPAAILASGCITSAKIRNPSPNCPACQKSQYNSSQSAPVDRSQLYPVPESNPPKANGGSPTPGPYPAPPPEARRLLPNIGARTISSMQSTVRQAMNSFE